MIRSSLVVLSLLCLAATGCVRVTATCPCQGGSPNPTTGTACGLATDAIGLALAASAPASIGCVASGGNAGECSFETVAVASCAAREEGELIAPVADPEFSR